MVHTKRVHVVNSFRKAMMSLQCEHLRGRRGGGQRRGKVRTDGCQGARQRRGAAEERRRMDAVRLYP